MMLVLCAVCQGARANPSFDHTESGDIQISENQNVYDIHSSDRSIGVFNSFGNQAGEVINSIQPSASNSALFKVSGSDPSVFYGSLNANSHVFLINPNGVLFGPGSQVNAPGLIASALDIANNDFLSGKYIFQRDMAKDPGYVLNEGSLTAEEGGYIALIGGAVANKGNMTADKGSVVLASGDGVTLSFDADGLVSAKVEMPITSPVYDFSGNKLNDAISNGGTIRADGGYVLMTAKARDELFDNVINHSGMIEARSISNQNGEIVLDGGSEGAVRVTGALDVSGEEGGGTILVNGERVGIDRNSVLNADALSSGNGGRVIVVAEGTTWFYGAVSARGGEISGNGGFVEISGKKGLFFDGSVDTSAAHGLFGELLFDPTDITIHDALDGAQGNDGLLPDLTNGTVGAGTFNLGETALQALALTSNIQLQATNNITINNLADNTLSLAITNLGALTITADSDASGAGAFVMDTGDTLRTLGGAVTISGASATIGAINTTPTAVLAGGAITVTTTGNLSVSGALTSNGGVAVGVGLGGGIVSLTGGDITAAAINTSGSNAFGVVLAVGGNAGAINLNATDGTPTITLNGNLTAVGGTGIIGGAQGNGAAVTLSDPTTLGTNVTVNTTGTVNGAVTASGNITGNQTLNLTAGTAAISLRGVDVDTLTFTSGGALALNGNLEADNDISFTTVGAITLGGVTQVTGQDSDSSNTPKNITFNAGNAITGAFAFTLQGGTVTLPALNIGTQNLTMTANEIELTGAANSILSSGAVILQPFTASTNIAINAAPSGGVLDLTTAEIGTLADGFSSITIGRSDGTGAVTVNAVTFTDPVTIRSGGVGGNITTNGAFTTAASNSAITFTAGTGNSGTFTQSAASTLASGAGVITITADSMALDATGANSITGTGAITLRSSTVSRPVVVGAAGAATDLALTASEIAALTNGFSSITIGQAAGTGGMTVSAITFNDPVSLLSSTGGTTSVNGQITGAGNASVTIDGFGTTSLAAGVVTAGNAITISDNVSLGGNISLDSTNAGASAAGADLILSGTVDADLAASNRTLTLRTGTGGDVTVSGAIGASQAIQTLTVVSVDDLTLPAVTTRDGGISVTTAGASPTILLNGNLTTDAGTNAGAITMTGPVTLGASVSIDTDSAGGTDADVTFSGATSTINGAQIFAVASGSGDINLGGAIGATTPLASLTLTGNDVTLANIGAGAAGVTGATSVTASTANLDTGSIIFTGTTYNANAQTFIAPSGNNFSLNAGAATTFTSTNDLVSFSTGSFLLANGSDLVITSAGGAISITGDIRGNSSEDVTLTSSGGATNTVSVGLIGNADEINTLAITGSTSITLNGNIVTSNAAGNTVTLTGPVILGANVSIATDDAANDGNISFSSTVNGAFTLSLDSGSADVALSGILGGSTPIEGLTINDADDVTLQAVTTRGTGITVVTAGGTPTITLNGNLTTDQGANAGVVSLTGSVTLGAGVSIDTDSAAGSDAAISFSSTIDGAQDLVLNSGSATTTISGNVGAGTAIGDGTGAAITLNSTGTTTFNGTLTTASGLIAAGLVSFTDNVTIAAGNTASTFNGSITLDGLTFASAGDVTFGDASADALTLSGGAVTINSTGGDPADDLTVNATTNGAQDLTLGVAGTTTFNGNVGATIPIGDGTGAALTLNSTGATIFNGTLATASGITQANAAGSVTFNENVTLGDGDTNTTFNANVGLAGLTFTANDPGTFGNAGTDTVTLSSSAVAITTSNDDLTFNSVVNGGQTLTLTTGSGNITFNAAIGSGVSLTSISIVNAGNVSFGSTVSTTGALTQSDGSGTTTFSDVATIGSDVSVANDAIVFNGTGALNSNAGTGAVTLTAQTGTISDGTGAEAANITGGAVTLNAATGVGVAGAAGDIDTAATSLNASVTGAGLINITEANNVTIGILTASGNVSLVSTAGAILDGNGSTTNVTSAGTITLTANNDIGAVSDPVEIATGFAVLSATSTGGGSVYTSVVVPGQINQSLPSGSIDSSTTDDLIVVQASAPAGGVSLTTTGSILTNTSNTTITSGQGIALAAGGTIGNTSNSVTFSSLGGGVSVSARGESDGLSENLAGNISRSEINVLNVPPGLVLYNNHILGGGNVGSYQASGVSLYDESSKFYRSVGIVDENHNDFPGLYDQDLFVYPVRAYIDRVSLDSHGSQISGMENLAV